VLREGQGCPSGRRSDHERAELQAQASQANAHLQAERDAFELLFREAKAEPQALAEQIDLLGSMLQDNRKQQRAVEELSRLHGRELELRQQLEAVRVRQQQAMQQRQQLITEGTAAKAELEAAEQAFNLTRQLLERQRLARNTSVEELRGQLRDGEPCPVCGSAEHPFHQPEALLQSLGRHDQAEEDAAQKQVETLNSKLVELRTQLGVVNAQLKDFQQQQQQLGEQLQPLVAQVQAHSLWPALAPQDDKARSSWLDSQLRRLDEEIGQDEKRQSALLALQKDAARLNQQLQAAQQAQQQAQRHLEQQHQALASDEQQLQQGLDDLAGVLPEEALKALNDDPANAFLALDQQIAQRLQQLDQRKDEQEEQQARQAQLDKLRDQQQARIQTLQQLQALKPTVVVPGHYAPGAALDASALRFTADYIRAFDVEAAKAKDSAALVQAMRARYPALAGVESLELSAKVAKGEMQWP